MNEKLYLYFIKPFEILRKCGKVSYRLALPSIISMIHSVSHASTLKRFHHDDSHVIQWKSIVFIKYVL